MYESICNLLERARGLASLTSACVYTWGDDAPEDFASACYGLISIEEDIVSRLESLEGMAQPEAPAAESLRENRIA